MPAAQSSKTRERQARIADRVFAEGSCTAQELAADLGVSIMTIHRDLDQLARRGLVRKYRGGVQARPPGAYESQLSFRMAHRSRQKEAIARAALQYVEPGTSLLLTDSTTVLAMVPGLADRAPLHVATNFLPAIRHLSEAAADADLTLLGLGGTYDVAHDAFVGLQAVDQVNGLSVDALFLSAAAVSQTHLLEHDETKVALVRAMMRAAHRTYLLVDQTKADRTAMHRVAELSACDLVITDSSGDPELITQWESDGVAVELADPPTAESDGHRLA